MATGGDIAFTFGADIEPLRGGMREASSSINKFSNKATRELRAVANQAVKLGAAATAAGAAMTAALFKKQGAVIDSLAKTADALGVTTERLQAFNHIAELNGISSEEMAKGLQRMEVRLGEAERRGGTAAQSLRDIGISLKDINSLNPDEQFEALSRAIVGVESHTLRASIATDLFGRSGLKMMKVLSQIHQEGLQPTVDTLKKYGAAINRVDAAKVEIANDAIAKASKIIEGLGTTITFKLAPYVTEVADQFTKAASSGKSFGNSVDKALSTAVRIAGKLADVIHGLKFSFKGLQVIAVGVSSAVANAVKLIANSFIFVADLALVHVNKIIDALNLLPNVDIANIDPFTDSAFMKGINHLGDHSINVLRDTREQMLLFAEQEMPSTGVEAFLDRVINKQNQVAEQTVKMLEDSGLAADGGGSLEGKKEAERERERASHLQRLINLDKNYTNSSSQIIKDKYSKEAALTVGAGRKAIESMAATSKKAFKINQAFGIADALISTYQGIAAALKLGPPLAIPAVAWAAATGFAQVSAIRSQSFGGGGKKGSSPGAPAPLSDNSFGGGATTQQAEPQRIVVEGLDPDTILSGRAITQLLQEAADNGAILTPG